MVESYLPQSLIHPDKMVSSVECNISWSLTRSILRKHSKEGVKWASWFTPFWSGGESACSLRRATVALQLKMTFGECRTRGAKFQHFPAEKRITSWPGIEPGSHAWQACILTTILPRRERIWNRSCSVAGSNRRHQTKLVEILGLHHNQLDQPSLWWRGSNS